MEQKGVKSTNKPSELHETPEKSSLERATKKHKTQINKVDKSDKKLGFIEILRYNAKAGDYSFSWHVGRARGNKIVYFDAQNGKVCTYTRSHKAVRKCYITTQEDFERIAATDLTDARARMGLIGALENLDMGICLHRVKRIYAKNEWNFNSQMLANAESGAKKSKRKKR